MSSPSQSGNAQNNAMLALLIEYATQMAATFNPSNALIFLANLQTILTTAVSAQTDVSNLVGPNKIAENDRKAFFDAFKKILPGLRRSYKATAGVTEKELQDFDSIVRKLTGREKYHPDKPGDPVEPKPTHSDIQSGYVDVEANLELLISLLENTAGFNPNEVEYKVATIKTTKTTMGNLTKNVNTTGVPLKAARTLRDQLISSNPDSVCTVGQLTKDYMLSVLPKGTSMYKAVVKIKFKKSKTV